MLKRFWLKLMVVLSCSLPGIVMTTTAMGQETRLSLRAGAYAQDITPPKFPITVNGNMADHFATAAHDPLHARCIVLKNAETALAIVVCDSCMIPRELMDKAKSLTAAKTGIRADQILISATHSHSCPTVAAVFQSDPDQEYSEFLAVQIAKGIERASSQAEPARVGWGSVQQPSLLFNRRWNVKKNDNGPEMVENPFGSKADRIITNPGFNNPGVSESVGLIDPQLSFLSIQSRDGRPIALLANYSLHYIGGVAGDVVSADYFGEFAQRVTRQLKASEVQPAFVGILSNGTSGDVNNVDFRQTTSPKREPYEQMGYAAELLAQDIGKAYAQIEYHDALPLKMIEAEVELGVRKPTDEELKLAEQKLAATPERPLKDRFLIYARETTLLAKYPNTVRAKVQAIRIGSLGIATSPCETFTATGLDVKKNSPFKSTFNISLANGYNGYLPPPDQMALGGYETWRARSSYVDAEAEPRILATMKRLLVEVSR